MKTMSSTKEQDFDIKLKAFHRRSSRHVLVRKWSELNF